MGSMRAIVLSFRGATYRIPETKAFAVGEEVEDIITLDEMLRWQSGAVRFRKLARAFGVMLRAAGVDVTDEEVHADMMADVRRAAVAAARGQVMPTDQAATALAGLAVQALIGVLMNGAPEEFLSGGATDAGDDDGGDDSPPGDARPS